MKCTVRAMDSAYQVPFRFEVSTNLRYGVGESEKLGAEITKLGYMRIAAIVDQGVFRHPQILKALESVRNSKHDLDVFESMAVEPTYDNLEAFRRRLAGKSYDCLVGIGGGSALDLTKRA